MSIGPCTHISQRDWDAYSADITAVAFDPSFANFADLTSTSCWFTNFYNLQIISGIKYLKTDKVTDMSDMFAWCSSLTSINVSGFNTSQVTNMSSMFMHSPALKSLDLSNFNTSNVKNMACMFLDCTGLEHIDLSSFDTGSVSTFSNMFDGCSSLTSLNLRHFNTSHAINMVGTFNNISLNKKDISSFQTDNELYMGGLFSNCVNLTTIYVGKGWTTKQVKESNGMFYFSRKLVGGDGTTYDPNFVDKTKAHTGEGGYLTELILGDANGNGELDPEDVIETSNAILGNPSEQFVEEAADMNGDKKIDAADIVLMINEIKANKAQ
jgi:surface protein